MWLWSKERTYPREDLEWIEESWDVDRPPRHSWPRTLVRGLDDRLTIGLSYGVHHHRTTQSWTPPMVVPCRRPGLQARAGSRGLATRAQVDQDELKLAPSGYTLESMKSGQVLPAGGIPLGSSVIVGPQHPNGTAQIPYSLCLHHCRWLLCQTG
jgi:hypothetical protein